MLVACVGNIFLGDDGFGTEVAAALRRREMPEGARVEDFGIRSVHLVYELLGGYDALVLVDTVARQEGPAGTLFVIEPDVPPRDPDGEVLPEVMLDAHDLSPGGVMALVPTLGGTVGRIVVVGCQPGSLEEGHRSHRRGPRRRRTGGGPGVPGRRRGTEEDGMRKLVWLVVLGGAAAAVVASLPDIKRYLAIRNM